MSSPARIGAVVLLASALGLAAVGQPDVATRAAQREAELSARLAERTMHIDPAELLGLMHNNRLALRLLDLRDEASFNAFHLLDARRVTLSELAEAPLVDLPPDGVVVVMSHDEAAAEQAWRLLQVRRQPNVYVLAGGVNLWLDVFREGRLAAEVPGPAGPDAPRHRFPRALGSRWAWARPAAQAADGRSFTPQVEVQGPSRRQGGGCG